MPKNPNTIFDKRIFWDVNSEIMDFDAKANFVIVRIFERSNVEDVRNCIDYYGFEKIKTALTNEKWLNKTTVYFACAILENELTDYRCYNIAQLNPEHWHY